MGLIDKDIIVAEIEKKIKQYKNERNTIIKDTDNSKELASRIIMCQEIISFLDTIEVKEVNIENSMTCEVGWYDGFLLDYTQEQQDELLKKIGANVGDKIRVILAKE